MKKLVFMFAAAAMFAACQHNGKNAANAEGTDSLAADTMVAGDTLTYEGEGPAADGTYKYSLSLYGDSIKEFAYEQVAVTPKGEQTMARTTGVARLIENNGKNYVRVQSEKNGLRDLPPVRRPDAASGIQQV